MLTFSRQKIRKPVVDVLCCVFFSAFLSTSCGTLYNLAVEESPLSFTSRPNHATIIIKGYKPCKTPCVIKVDPVKTRRIRAQLAGHDEETKWADTRVSFPVFANALLGFPLGGVGLLIDWASDSLTTWSETRFHFKLDRSTPDSEEEEDEDDEAEDQTEENQDVESQEDPEPAPKEPPPPPKPKASIPTPLPPKKTDPKPAPPEKDVPEAFTNQVRAEISETDMDRSIEQYYGKVSTQSHKKIESRLMKQLYDMKQKGEDLDLEEAIRRDRFQENDATRRK